MDLLNKNEVDTSIGLKSSAALRIYRFIFAVIRRAVGRR
jgi:hypothetical protein